MGDIFLVGSDDDLMNLFELTLVRGSNYGLSDKRYLLFKNDTRLWGWSAWPVACQRPNS